MEEDWTTIRSKVFTGKLTRCFLYLHEHHSKFDIEVIESIKLRHSELKKSNPQTISLLHLEVAKYLKEAGCRIKLEEEVFGIDVDVLLFGEDEDQASGVLEIQGYQHYFRNKSTPNGRTYFKEKILKGVFGDDKYYTIDIYTWSLLDNQGKRKLVNRLFENTSFIPKESKTKFLK